MFSMKGFTTEFYINLESGDITVTALDEPTPPEGFCGEMKTWVEFSSDGKPIGARASYSLTPI